jgi:hypothetical protein
VRAGHVPSSLVLGGRRIDIQRPRARSGEGHELSLPSWFACSSWDPLDERAFEQMVVGVSTRRYARSLEPLPQEVGVRGISKSAVSERFVVGTERRLAELMRRDLSGLGRPANRWGALRRPRRAGSGRHRRQRHQTPAGA